jgi:hypothetical protein
MSAARSRGGRFLWQADITLKAKRRFDLTLKIYEFRKRLVPPAVVG